MTALRECASAGGTKVASELRLRPPSPPPLPETGFLMACTIKARSRVGCSTERREGERERERKGKGELFRERAMGRHKEEGDEGGKGGVEEEHVVQDRKE